MTATRISTGHGLVDTQGTHAGGGLARAIVYSTPNHGAPAQDSYDRTMLTIVTLGELLDDLEKMRIANTNRIAALERETGMRWAELDDIARNLATAEKTAEKQIKRIWRQHPLAPWAAGYLGLGEKSIARLIAVIGDPAERQNVAKLWAYCGHGNPNLKRAKGMTQEDAFKLGNPRAKKQVWLISTSLLKAGNRAYYDAGRAKVEVREWTDGHKHAAALRYAGKMFLRDLWVAARAGLTRPDAHQVLARAGEGTVRG